MLQSNLSEIRETGMIREKRVTSESLVEEIQAILLKEVLNDIKESKPEVKPIEKPIEQEYNMDLPLMFVNPNLYRMAKILKGEQDPFLELAKMYHQANYMFNQLKLKNIAD